MVVRRKRAGVGRRRNPAAPRGRMVTARKPAVERFRAPDVKVGTRYAVWYGPGGRNAEQATEVEHEGYGNNWRVSEYQYLEGYVDDFDPNFPFLRTTTSVEARDAREAASLGVERIGHYGGDEETVESLP